MLLSIAQRYGYISEGSPFVFGFIMRTCFRGLDWTDGMDVFLKFTE